MVQTTRAAEIEVAGQRMCWLPTTALTAHPQNPRIVLRDDVVESIAAQVRAVGEMHPAHALLVRPLGDGYQIVSGHTRAEAAKRAGVDTVPCWVQPMTDAEAFMLLVLSNAQGELSPLEIGVHAFHAIEKGSGGAGVEGGYREYARQIGADYSYITRLAHAAEVYESLELLSRDNSLVDKARQLSAIHKADRALWPVLVTTMLSAEWSVADTEHWAAKIREFAIPTMWQSVFLPYDDVVVRFLASKEFSPSTVVKLIGLAESTEAVIRARTGDDADEMCAAYRAWLAAERGGAAWDTRALVQRQREINIELDELERTRDNSWQRGDWRSHVPALADGAVALLLTDPPYGVDFQSDYRLDRRMERRHERIAADSGLDAAAAEVEAMLTAMLPKLTDNAHVLCFTHWRGEPIMRAALERVGLMVRGSLVWVKNATGMGDPATTFAPQHERILHAVKGSPVLFRRESDVLSAARVASDTHPTEKPVDLLTTLITATTVEGELVADPFAGVASTLVAAKRAGRTYWGCEIDETYFRAGAERLGGAA